MRPGQMRERISVTAEQKTEDRLGGGAVTWPEQFKAWANVAPLRGNEQFESQKVQSTQQYRVTVRYRADITTAMRIEWAGKRLNIIAISNPDQRRKYLEMICEAGAV